MDYRKRTLLVAAVVGSIVLTIAAIRDAWLSGVVFVAIMAAVTTILMFITRQRGVKVDVSHAAAQAAAGDDGVIVYWQPECIYCDLLKTGLGRARNDVAWVNIVEDPEAGEFVAAYRNGNQEVPTAITGAGEMIDANPAAIKAHLRVAKGATRGT